MYSTARLVFTSKVGTGCTATVVDLGNRFRLIVNDVECFPIFGCQVVREARVVSSTGENPCTCTYFKVGHRNPKSQTARLVFTSKVGTGCTATVVDLGNRFRLIVNGLWYLC